MIHTEYLSYRYPNSPELYFPNVSVQQGGTLLLQGPSGSGKSTWLALAAGLLPASFGQMVVAEQFLEALGTQAALDRWRAQTIGFLPQKLHLSSALSVHENLRLAQWAAGQPQNDQRIAEALRMLDVQALAQRLPTQLSGGQAQRVALARAVLLQPRVILADEPTAHLDNEAACACLTLLQASAERCAATLVVATHDDRVATAFANKKGLQRLHLGSGVP